MALSGIIRAQVAHEGAKELLTTTHVYVRCTPRGLKVGGNARKISILKQDSR